jgi:integrase
VRNPACNLTKQITTADGRRRFCPAVESANGRVKANVVVVDGKEEHHPEGCYYIEWRENGKRRRLSVGKDHLKAHAAKLRKETELAAVSRGVPLASSAENGRRSVAVAVEDFLEETKLTKKPKTLAAYSKALSYFTESCHKIFLEDIERRDLLNFAAFLRDEKELHPRTCWNKFSNVMSFLKANDIRGLAKKNDWPSYVEEEPEVYEQEELDTLFAACDDEERLWFEFFLMTGMREQEVMHAYWSDINFAASTVRVSHKPDLGWTPKAYKEREVPIPQPLVASLEAHKAKSNRGCKLVFPTAGCRPKLDFLDCLKAVAERGELEPENFWLHKFRSTFATMHLQSGIDLRTVQDWLGHVDLASTMRYLKSARGKGILERVNATFARSASAGE